MPIPKQHRYLTVSAPDTEATVDFLSRGVAVELRVHDGKLEVKAKMAHEEGGYTWDEHEVSWPLPKKPEKPDAP